MNNVSVNILTENCIWNQNDDPIQAFDVLTSQHNNFDVLKHNTKISRNKINESTEYHYFKLFL